MITSDFFSTNAILKTLGCERRHIRDAMANGKKHLVEGVNLIKGLRRIGEAVDCDEAGVLTVVSSAAGFFMGPIAVSVMGALGKLTHSESTLSRSMMALPAVVMMTGLLLLYGKATQHILEEKKNKEENCSRDSSVSFRR